MLWESTKSAFYAFLSINKHEKHSKSFRAFRDVFEERRVLYFFAISVQGHLPVLFTERYPFGDKPR
jgi:hypothetical protein